MRSVASNKILTDIINISLQAGQEILNFYKRKHEKSKKEEFPVTKADLLADSLIKKGLGKYLDMEIGLLSEETVDDKQYLNHDRVFIVDPIDGTKDFVHKTDDFSMMIAYVEKREPVIGVVFKPVGQVLYYANKDQGAFVETGGQTKKIAVSREDDYTKMRLLVSRYHLREPEIKLKKALNLAGNIEMGSAGLKLCAIADGRAHIYINTSDKTGEWDAAAGSVILREAGGLITDLDGNALDFLKEKPYNNRGFVASNGICHQEILNKLNEILSKKN